MQVEATAPDATATAEVDAESAARLANECMNDPRILLATKNNHLAIQLLVHLNQLTEVFPVRSVYKCVYGVNEVFIYSKLKDLKETKMQEGEVRAINFSGKLQIGVTPEAEKAYVCWLDRQKFGSMPAGACVDIKRFFIESPRAPHTLVVVCWSLPTSSLTMEQRVKELEIFRAQSTDHINVLYHYVINMSNYIAASTTTTTTTTTSAYDHLNNPDNNNNNYTSNNTHYPQAAGTQSYSNEKSNKRGVNNNKDDEEESSGDKEETEEEENNNNKNKKKKQTKPTRK